MSVIYRCDVCGATAEPVEQFVDDPTGRGYNYGPPHAWWRAYDENDRAIDMCSLPCAQAVDPDTKEDFAPQ